MGLLNLFRKQTQTKTAIEKFKATVASVQRHTAFLMSDDFSGMDPKAFANKMIYQTIDKDVREKLSDEENIKLDKLNEVEHVIKALKGEVNNGGISNDELQEIMNSDEYRIYTSIS